MVRHIVLIRARAGVTEAEIAGVFAQLAALEGRIPGMGPVHAGRSESPERIERGYMHGFTVDFDGWESLAAYAAHPDHIRAGAELVACAEGGIDGILVFDLPLTDASRGTPPC